jgi:hypothetical protein
MVKWWQGCQENNSFPKTPYTTSAPTRLRTGFTPSSLFNPPHHTKPQLKNSQKEEEKKDPFLDALIPELYEFSQSDL